MATEKEKINKMTQKEIQDRFIKEMPAPYGQQAADNTITDNAAGWDDVDFDSSLGVVLGSAFWWDKSKEGFQYWQRVARELGMGCAIGSCLAEFGWDDYPVTVWPGAISIGCQKITKEMVEFARARIDFRNNNDERVYFSEKCMHYGYRDVSLDLLEELYLQLDEVGF